MITTVIFDLDGTIADSISAFVETYNDLSEQFGYRKANSPEIFRQHTTWRFFTKILKIPFYSLPSFYLQGKKKFHEKIDQVRAFPGMVEVIHRVDEKYAVGIISSNFEENVHRFLRNEGIDNFEFIYSGASLFGKHWVLKSLLRQRHLKREEVIYVGDEMRDIIACKKAGIRIIACTWGFDWRPIIEKGKPDYIVEKPEEIEHILL